MKNTLIIYLLIFSISLMPLAYTEINEIAKKSDAYYPVYKNTTEKIPAYLNITIPYNFSCTKGICNGTREEKIIIGYDDKIIPKVEYLTDGKNKIYGYIVQDKNNFIIWKYDIKGRNMKEFGRCRQYEIDKGVCIEI